jgi:hypothetical protein
MVKTNGQQRGEVNTHRKGRKKKITLNDDDTFVRGFLKATALVNYFTVVTHIEKWSPLSSSAYVAAEGGRKKRGKTARGCRSHNSHFSRLFGSSPLALLTQFASESMIK